MNLFHSVPVVPLRPIPLTNLLVTGRAAHSWKLTCILLLTWITSLFLLCSINLLPVRNTFCKIVIPCSIGLVSSSFLLRARIVLLNECCHHFMFVLMHNSISETIHETEEADLTRREPNSLNASIEAVVAQVLQFSSNCIVQESNTKIYLKFEATVLLQILLIDIVSVTLARANQQQIQILCAQLDLTTRMGPSSY